MTIHQALQFGYKTLHKTSDSPELDTEVLLSHTVKQSKSFILAHAEQKLTKSQQETFQKYLKRRQKHEPIAYIIGIKEFFNLELKVTQDVLIPRPETEELVEHTLLNVIPGLTRDPNVQSERKLTILELGTGSGAIAISLAKNLPNSHITASDISDKALKVAKHNAQTHNIANISFITSDLLNNIPKQQFHIIIANLPYLSEKTYQQAQKELTFEPKNALTAPENGLFYYNKLLKTIKPYLQTSEPYTTLILELGHDQFPQMEETIKNHFPKAITKQIYTCSNTIIIGLQTVIPGSTRDPNVNT